MHFSTKCNSGRIAIQWFHIKHYLDYQYTKLQPYTFRLQKMCVFARYATLVPPLYTRTIYCGVDILIQYAALLWSYPICKLHGHLLS